MMQLELSYTPNGNKNFYNHFGKEFWQFLIKLDIYLLHNQAIPCLDIYLREMMVHKELHTNVLLTFI